MVTVGGTTVHVARWLVVAMLVWAELWWRCLRLISVDFCSLDFSEIKELVWSVVTCCSVFDIYSLVDTFCVFIYMKQALAW